MTTAEQVRTFFAETFGRPPEVVIRASGRINIIGEHTDYNDGFVLPGAIDKYIFFAVALNDTGQCRLHALDVDESETADLDNLVNSPKLWANYLLGIVEQFQGRGISVPGIDCAFGGNLPIGSGMSSSAALETGFATALQELLGTKFSKPEIAKLAQQSSHEFVGVPCGIMDQFASIMGQQNQVIRLDCRSLEHEYIPFELPDYRIVMVNSKVSHSLADSAYSTRVQECREGVSLLQRHYPQVSSLRDVTLEQLTDRRSDFPEVIYRRCHYVVSENERLHQACIALRAGRIDILGQLLNETHAGLRDEYEVSAPEVNFLVDFAQQYEGVAGARIMGGGFGGCSINLVREDRADAFAADILAAYSEDQGIEGETYFVSVVDGTGPM